MAMASQKMRSSDATYQSIVAYDGTQFEGFQRQRKGHRTVQGTLEAALVELAWQGRAIKAAGRTDTGVHAEGQVIAFQLAWDHSVEDLTAALNANLPPDVAIRKSKPAPRDFDPRFDAISRTYRYSIFIDPVRNPLRERYAWRLIEKPDRKRLEQAARLFEGELDFAAYGRPPREGSSTVRVVHSCRWTFEHDYLTLSINANAFLYHMVRHLTAAIVQVGLGVEQLTGLQELLEEPTRRRQGRLAPAAGLCLAEVTYPDEVQTG
jgi:tRNA pseudouridine38-40 synthase